MYILLNIQPNSIDLEVFIEILAQLCFQNLLLACQEPS